MNQEKYTERMRGFLQSAQMLALREGHQRLIPDHILKVLLDDPEGLAANLIGAAGGDSRAVYRAVEANLAKQPKVEGQGAGQIYMAPETARLFEQAEAIAEKAGDSFVTVERMLIALVLAKGTPAAEALATGGVKPQALEKAVQELRKGRTADSASAEDTYDALKKYARDLTQAARDGKLDPVIGRDEEIRRTIQVLSRRTKNNPVLIGAGKADGAMDASNMLKPALARGELHCVGATPLDEYRKHIEKDAALARRFQPVFVAEPTVEDTISILRGIKEKYELHHGVRIADSSIVAAATLSNRYITDRFLPDKAIDLMDEAASRIRMQVDSKPEALDELDRRIMQLKIEKEALKKESDSASRDRLERLEKELSELEEKSAALTAQWTSAKDKLADSQKVKEQLDKARSELEVAQRRGELAKAGELAYGVIPDLEKKLKEAETHEVAGGKGVKEEVMPEDIAAVVSRWTGVPVDKMLEGERAKLLRMEEEIHKRVIGQDEAVVAVANAVRRARAGLQDPNRPIGSFLFLGPTGVGKTELTKAIAAFLFDDDNAMVRIDMSEFMEKHAVSRLIGAPPGYVGYDEGGVLTEAVRRRPYQVVLFDEVEKAHPDVFNVLLQVLDDGRLTDGQGRTVDFKNTLIILTSNLGSSHLAALKDGEPAESVREQVMEEVRRAFRPEFLNRLDEILLFNRLSRAHMTDIVEVQMQKLLKLLADRKIELKLDVKAMQWLANRGYDPVYGARPLKRVIQRSLQNPLATQLLEGKIHDGDTVEVGVENGELTVGGERVMSDAAAD